MCAPVGSALLVIFVLTSMDGIVVPWQTNKAALKAKEGPQLTLICCSDKAHDKNFDQYSTDWLWFYKPIKLSGFLIVPSI